MAGLTDLILFYCYCHLILDGNSNFPRLESLLSEKLSLAPCSWTRLLLSGRFWLDILRKLGSDYECVQRFIMNYSIPNAGIHAFLSYIQNIMADKSNFTASNCDVDYGFENQDSLQRRGHQILDHILQSLLVDERFCLFRSEDMAIQLFGLRAMVNYYYLWLNDTVDFDKIVQAIQALQYRIKAFGSDNGNCHPATAFCLTETHTLLTEIFSMKSMLIEENGTVVMESPSSFLGYSRMVRRSIRRLKIAKGPSIPSLTFKGIYAIEYLNLEGMTFASIGNEIGIPSLIEVHMPSSLKVIRSGAFDECQSLRMIHLLSHNVSIETELPTDAKVLLPIKHSV